MSLSTTEYRGAATTFRDWPSLMAALIEACADGKTAVILRVGPEGIGTFQVEVFDISALWRSAWLVEA